VEPRPAKIHPAKRKQWRMAVAGCMEVRVQVHF